MRRPAALFPIALALGATILALGPGAQAAPTPIRACQTLSQPGSYVLEHNLTATGDCLVITTGFVTIDLAGFLISAGGFGIRTGVSTGAPLQGYAVRNGSIFAPSGGVALDGELSIVEELRVSTMGTGISTQGIVRANTVVVIAEGSGTGIIASGTVTDNHVTGPTRGTGIAAAGTLRGNTVINAAIGIAVSAGSTVIGNTVTGARLFGIQVACPSNLADNTAVNNAANLVLNGEGCHNEDTLAP